MSRETPVRYVQSDWSDERTERLTVLWDKGQSASQIARELGGVSRAAVMGKVHRMKLGGRKQPSAPRGARTPPPLRKIGKPRSTVGLKLAGNGCLFTEPTDPRTPRAELSVAAFEPLPGSSPRPWAERLSGMCCWPVGGEGADMLACCDAVHARGWCLGHYRRGVQPASVRSRVDVRVGRDYLKAAAHG